MSHKINTFYSLLYLLSLITSTLSKDYTIYSTKLYPYMQISMNIYLTTPTNCSTIFAIDDFLSIHITSNNILQLKIQNNPIHNHLIHIHKPYTINITLNPSNNHYFIYSDPTNITSQIYPFLIIPSPLLYTISHPLTIDNQYAQISHLLITTNEQESNGYILYSSLSMPDNKIFANIPLNQSIFATTQQNDEYDSIFGPGVTEADELVYIIIIAVAVFCVLCIVAYIIIGKCHRKNKSFREASYEKVNHGAKYLDETAGDDDINKFKDAQIPLTQKTSFNQKLDEINKEKERKEGEYDHEIVNEIGVNETDKLITIGGNTDDGTNGVTAGGHTTTMGDSNSLLTPQNVYVEREDSISAMDI